MTDVTSFDGTRLALYSWGSDDDPVVVLVHGLGMSADSWGEVPERLAAEHRLVAYDLRGHAQSGDARSGGYGLPAHAADLAAVLDAVVPEGGSAVVVGHSLGGAVLLRHVEEHGADRIAGAVFVGSGGAAVTAPGFPARHLPRWARARLASMWFALLRVGARWGRRLRPVRAISDRGIRHFAFAPGEPQEAVARMRDDFLSTRPLALAGSALAALAQDGIQWAPALTVPTLIVHGSRDPEVPNEEADRLLGALPDGELFTILDAGHMLPLTDPDEVVEQVTRWVRRVTAEEGAAA
ncbi:alpha/beta fold hydrolase [Blastococcus xanthinilyticus]|uniref:Alpha-beta hydrolase superfamily lysophospholipase n=1 Tax=Blastococcus xanthinilyticus TaxID=1564164 RepID=A0A5S5CXS1_9ACTN|nr:alpha/beta hydrolase [Blastococcus xanthinilyticus]TYP88580.1 alpha-beta hydrolase superfamily lysophospholipase [Blastococcus xanthinilyticus]